jgi:hypothetical protein
MNLDVIEMAAYLSLGLLVYTFLLEISKPKQGAQKLVTWFFLAVILLVIGYFGYIYWKKQDKVKNDIVFEEEDNSDLHESESEPDRIVDFVQGKYKPQRKDFAIIDGVSPMDGGQISFEEFKEWYLEPDFIQSYTSAIRQGYRIKRRRLLEVKKQFSADLKALKGVDKPKDGLTNLLSKLDKNDDTKVLETTISEIDLLLKEIKRKESNLSIETTRNGLIMALTDKKNGLDSLIGRDEIKDQITAKLYAFSQNPRIFLSNFQNMAIYGGSGVGKTKLACVLGFVYSKCGILIRDHVHIITPQNLVTAYVNESGRMTRKLLLANLESIVFIDEAYSLSPPQSILGNGIDHGHEAITEVVNFLDKLKGLSIVIVAGYQEEMDARFMGANEGLPRRFPNILVLKPYNSKELTDILIKFLLTNCTDLNFTERQANYLYTIVDYINKENPEVFKTQAGAMENLSNAISTAIYSTPGKNWLIHYEQLILCGVNSYLAQNNITLELLE